MAPIPSYRIALREERNERIRQLHSSGATAPQISIRLGLAPKNVNVILKRMGLVPHYPHDGLSVLTSRKRKHQGGES